MDDDFDGKFRLERVKEYLRKRKTMRNITPAIIFSKLIKRKVKISVVIKPHVLLICLNSMLHYELNYPDKNMLSLTLILIARVFLDGWLADSWMAAGWRLDGSWLAAGWRLSGLL